MTGNWIEEEIAKSQIYLEILEKLSKRKMPASKKVTPLKLLLGNPDETAEVFSKWVQSPAPQFEPHQKILLLTGEKVRTIYTASWPDRIILMGIQALLSRHFEPLYSNRLYSFRKGRGTFQAHQAFHVFLKKHPHAWVAKRDITQYGDSISQEILYQKLNQHIPTESHPRLYTLLRQALAPEFIDAENQRGQVTAGIPSGSPLTPVLENFYLMELDQEMDDICNQDHSCFYARYGDDYVFSCPDEKKFLAIIEKMDAKINTLGLRFSEGKKMDLQLGVSKQYLEWLGATFSNHGNISTRPKHFHELYSTFIKGFNGFLLELSSKNNDVHAAMPLIKTAIHQFLDDRTNPHLIKLTLNKNHPTLTKMIDKNIRHYLVRWLKSNFRIKKSEAWRLLRKLEVPSLNFQRRMRWKLK